MAKKKPIKKVKAIKLTALIKALQVSQAVSTKQIAKVFVFASSSGSGTYETLQYNDGTCSCGCPGWTRRVQPDGSRSCKHTRCIDMGRGESEAESFKDYTAQRPILTTTTTKETNAITKKDKATDRNFGEFKRKLVT